MRTESFINEYVYLLLSYKKWYVEITMEKYNAKRDPKVYAALSLLGASGCRLKEPQTKPVQIDLTELGTHSIHYEGAGVAFTADTLKERDYGETLLRKIHAVNENYLSVKKIEKDGKTSFKLTGKLPKEHPSQDALAFIVQEAAGKDKVATYKELRTYFKRLVWEKGDNPEYDIFAQPEPVEETANKNLEKKIEPEEKDTEGSATEINIVDQTTTLDQKMEGITEVPSNPEPQASAGYIKKCGVGSVSALGTGLVVYGIYRFCKYLLRDRGQEKEGGSVDNFNQQGKVIVKGKVPKD